MASFLFGRLFAPSLRRPQFSSPVSVLSLLAKTAPPTRLFSTTPIQNATINQIVRVRRPCSPSSEETPLY